MGYFIQFIDPVNCVMHMFVNGTSGGSRNARTGGGQWRQIGAQLTTGKLTPVILVTQ